MRDSLNQGRTHRVELPETGYEYTHKHQIIDQHTLRHRIIQNDHIVHSAERHVTSIQRHMHQGGGDPRGAEQLPARRHHDPHRIARN